MQIFVNERLSQYDPANPGHGPATSDSINWINDASIVKHEHIFVFERFKPKGKLMPIAGDDETGLECSLNHFHVTCGNLHEAIGTAVLLFGKIADLWQVSAHSGAAKLRQIVSIAPISDGTSRFEVTYRCHVIRSNQSWLAADLNMYEEVVMVCE